ncbi:N,N'-diacetylchitobiose phosphorylase [Ruminiclostridium hungatei]|uniref:N,N'-diacetylchitobiose phosphorylase n=1 Tax=Ruminiclostridium hungatei TaxID=48256 RepID=A0A1V4SGK2_RUMHU|nr:glucoamylase family protein [Ruminiclostridium hungatei]OPX42863.1 N,N'-diacetylchitobiose phosphorylase [Ruminiclostridium hungatei]
MNIWIFFIVILLTAAITVLITRLSRHSSSKLQIEDIVLCSDELERHAEELAKAQGKIGKKRSVRMVSKRVENRYKSILETYENLNRDAASAFPIPPAAEWLLDNFYIIEEQKNVVIKELSESRNVVPVLADGPYSGFPRIYSIAVEIVSHVDGNANEKVIKDFITAYQRYTFLSVEELWLLTLMIKAALMEKLWVVCRKMDATRRDWYKAQEIAGMIKGFQQDCEAFKEQITGLDDLSPAFVEFLIRKLRKEGSKTLWMIDCIDSILVQNSANTDSYISIDHHNQAVNQVSIGNIINSLRSLAGYDSTALFESLSEVERLLRQDPAGIYSQMDFNSRNYYRNIIVELAKKYETTEINIARLSCRYALEAKATEGNGSAGDGTANASQATGPESLHRHVGYYLIGKGQIRLLQDFSKEHSRNSESIPFTKRQTVNRFIVVIAGLSLVFAALPVICGLRQETGFSRVWVLVLGVLGLLPAGEIAATLVNSVLSRVIKPSRFARLELKQGIPEELATMVIVPTLIPNVKRTLELIDNLEVFYLANKGENLYFSLVGDFKDSAEETLPEDAEIIRNALARIEQLNKKYPREAAPIFYFLCRKRQFNENQQKWMGWERKRGAIIELNRVLRGNKNTGYVHLSAALDSMPRVKYVITLDADTQLPLEAARQLVGTIAHPMNMAVYNEEKGLVTDGYGILQPRIDVNIESAGASLFTKVFAGQGGIDPYTTTVSDVYQDAFGEGIFTGKGIYEIDIFQQTLDGVIPDNTVLSHDLLEGSYLRTGLVTDIELIDGYPAKYNSFMMRLHRWTRGDWQLLPWIFGQNQLSLLSKWKMFDNLRRSLVYPVMALIFLLCMLLLPESCGAWIVLSILALCSPVISYFVHLLMVGDYRVYVAKRSATILTGFKAILLQIGLMLTFAPYQAYLMTDAIIKTLVRVLVTGKNLLEWITAADMELALKNDLPGYYRRMWFAPVYGVVGLAAVMFFHRGYLPLYIVVLGLWLLSPWLAFYISKPAGSDDERLTEEKNQELRLLSRKTWCYFDEFAGKEENYLPADNYQEEPYKGAAHRTSPTNIGLLLVSQLAARDMGYINSIDLMKRVRNTVDTVDRMQKWNGHLYNWYNTTTLEVLRPKFVSTVDSGNFAGYLMVLAEGLRQYGQKAIYDRSNLEAFFDLLELCNREIDGNKPYFDIDLLKKLISSQVEVDREAQAEDARKLEGKYSQLYESIAKYLDQLGEENKKGYWVKKLMEALNAYRTLYRGFGGAVFDRFDNIEELKEQLVSLRKRIQALIDGMHFRSLYDPRRNLFSIGYDVEEGHPSKSFYDLFASEARQTSLVAIAKGEVEKQHWFKLGRKLTRADREKGLVSWTGTMFEYLMPRLVIKSYPGTLIDRTYSFVVNAQIKYGRSKNIPWGISESCYYAFDIALNYQYRAFGVPYLGLKRGLVNDLVVAPYATVMAIDISPAECWNNIEKFRQLGAEGQFGLYEALDFTDSRLTEGQQCAVVKSYMVHHQGMSMLALVNYFKDNIMQARFHENPQIRAVDSLLQEKFPANVMLSKEHREKPQFTYRKQMNLEETVIRSITRLDLVPELHLLTNGSYNVMLTDRGSGSAKCHSLAVYRWYGDYMTSSGMFVYLRNINSNEFWSTTYNPTNTRPEAYKVIFSPHKAEYIRREGNIETNTEVLVSTEDDTEIRRVSIHNHSSSRRTIELTSYMEMVLQQSESDTAHPAFSKLFVKTEYMGEHNGLLAMRRKRDDVKQTVWGYHTVSTNGSIQGNIEYETDRAQFIGRNRNLSQPKVMDPDQPLSNSVGPVLDPVFSLRIRVAIEPGESAVVNFTVGTCDTRQTALDMLEKYSDVSAADRVVEMAWTRSIVEAGFINISGNDERAYLKLLPKLLYGTGRETQAGYIARNSLSQPDLWPFGISGDLPIVLITVHSRDSFEEIRWCLKLHDFMRLKGVSFDLVILITDEESYIQPIFEMIRDLAVSGRSCDLLDRRGGIFIRNSRQMNEGQKNLLFACAKLIINADDGVADYIDEALDSDEIIQAAGKQSENNTVFAPDLEKASVAVSENGKVAEKERAGQFDHRQESLFAGMSGKLSYFNGIGGFGENGDEYVVCLRAGQTTPAPWSNIIANDRFGFICTEAGGGFTWHLNSSQNKLTTWANDPVCDMPSEIVYLHQEEDEVWSCTPLPAGGDREYIIRHGFGYTSYFHRSRGLENELIQFTAADAPVKISILSLTNISDAEKTVDAAYYLKPVLGTEAGQTAPYIVTSFDGSLPAVLVNNVYSSDFRGLSAFLSCSEDKLSYTGHRPEFTGDNMDLSLPSGMKLPLEGTVGAGLDPCAAVKARVTIPAGGSRRIIFLFGQDRPEQLKELVSRYRTVEQALAELDRVKAGWKSRLKQIQVNTSDKTMNIMLNGWLQYQVLSCRVWARSGYYQAGGAFGFRDQLQDVMAVVYSMPEVTRKQILLHCRHQFLEGDVQHWWHEQKTNGIRTRYSDDLLWLPYVTCDYINTTGDYEILKQVEPYLQSPLLGEDEHERYEIPSVSSESGNVYEHCIRAIDKGLAFGPHGIPLMGGGDWNDGMNLVGVGGKGESVWLGWFLYCVLLRMLPVCSYMGDEQRAEEYRLKADEIIQALEGEAWDGSWYRRAYFDDGTPLGSIQNDECRIDSLSQSWAAISEAARSGRVEEAMSAVEKYLIDRKNGLIKLLTPPFYDGNLNPGYIKGYLPGVRENGGQYTHAATWVIYAFSKLGNGEQAWDLFNMVNPVNHSRTDMERMTYKVEPYVMAADVYAVYPNEGRGGWTWYTGAAGWMYRIGLEHILGIKKQGGGLIIDPCIPKKLNEYSVRYTFGSSVYEITIKNESHRNTTVSKIIEDGKVTDGNWLELKDDGKIHRVDAIM